MELKLELELDLKLQCLMEVARKGKQWSKSEPRHKCHWFLVAIYIVNL